MRKTLRRILLTSVAAATLVVFVACEAGEVIGAGQDDVVSSRRVSAVGGGNGKANGGSNATIRINVLLSTEITDGVRAEVSGIAAIADEIASIDALVVRGKASVIDDLLALPYVEAANPDAARNIPPGYSIEAESFADGLSTWNLDVVNATNAGFDNRVVAEDGEGVYVAVLDTGLVKNWRYYFPQDRIAEEYARSFTGSDNGTIAVQPNKWEHDTNSHGTHVTSTIIGYSLNGTPVNGVAPDATVIPVKTLNNNGSGWSSMVAAGITYVADLKAGPLADSPVVINMSLGGPVLDAVEREALHYAIDQGVIVVASAGNNGEAGMGYPGAYPPVISVAATGWVGEWYPGFEREWWYALDVADPTEIRQYYITDFSSRELGDQELDVAAPGSWVVGPYQLNQGTTSYFFLGGTSMASPHVAGVAALMTQKDATLDQATVETILKDTALPIAPGSASVYSPDGSMSTVTWGADATGEGLVTADAALSAVSAP